MLRGEQIEWEIEEKHGDGVVEKSEHENRVDTVADQHQEAQREWGDL